ncbi:MAG TPA: asparagine--tRNA ligase [Verrucomicrobiota bacterium]|nr:asparagine--tRNA ligase [Verrucomicrobiota bacterium]
MKHTDIVKILKGKDLFLGQNITLCGWVRTVRSSKGICFIELNDGSSFRGIQLVVDEATCPDYSLAQKQGVGAALKATGTVVCSYNNKEIPEINIDTLEVLGEAPGDYPLQKKRHTLEFLRTIAHLRARTNTFNAMFRIRSTLSAAIHHFFAGRGFVYVHTPILTASDCEGAGEMFRVTTLDPAKPKRPEISEADFYKDDFFGCKAGLTVSGQLEGETLAMALGKIYTFGPTFRAENSNTARHAAEFWQIEPEIAFAELEDLIELAEAMIKSLISDVLKKCPEEMAFFDKHYENGLVEKLRSIVQQNFVILEYTEAIRILKESKVQFEYPVEWGCDLQTEHERYITEKVYNKPVFVINYPIELKSFYMKQNPDGKTVAATDLLLPGVGEIIGGSQREDNLEKLERRMKELNMKREDYWWYLDLRRFGTAPHSGFGLGLERLLLYITGIGNIRDVAIFPRTKGNLQF